MVGLSLNIVGLKIISLIRFELVVSFYHYHLDISVSWTLGDSRNMAEPEFHWSEYFIFPICCRHWMRVTVLKTLLCFIQQEYNWPCRQHLELSSCLLVMLHLLFKFSYWGGAIMSIEKTTGMGAATWLPTRSLGLKQFFQLVAAEHLPQVRRDWESSGPAPDPGRQLGAGLEGRRRPGLKRLDAEAPPPDFLDGAAPAGWPRHGLQKAERWQGQCLEIASLLWSFDAIGFHFPMDPWS